MSTGQFLLLVGAILWTPVLSGHETDATDVTAIVSLLLMAGGSILWATGS